ncbi:MAG: hypothetical protein ACP5QS_06645 [bacterium]
MKLKNYSSDEIRLLQEVLRSIGEMENEEIKETSLWEFLSLIRGAKLNKLSFLFYQEVLGILPLLSEERRASLIYIMLPAIEEAKFGEREELAIYKQMMDIVETFGDEAQRESLRRSLLLSYEGYDEKEREIVLRKLREEREEWEKRREWDKDAIKNFLFLADMFYRVGSPEDFFQMVLRSIDKISRLADREVMVSWLSIAAKLAGNRLTKEQAEKLLGKILDRGNKLEDKWKATLLILLSSGLFTMDLGDTSPLYNKMLKMGMSIKEEARRLTTLAFVLLGLLKSGMQSSLLKEEIERWRKAEYDEKFSFRITLLWKIYQLCEESQFESALEKAREMNEYLRREALFIIASWLIKRIKKGGDSA